MKSYSKKISNKHFKRLYANYIIKKGIIEAGNNSKVLKEELQNIIKKLNKI